MVSQVNIYDLFGTCYTTPEAKPELYTPSRLFLTDNGEADYKRFFTAKDYTPFVFKKSSSSKKALKEVPPCVYGQPIIDYFNSADVRTALHIRDDAKAWDLCRSPEDGFNYTSGINGSLDVYTELKGLYKILKFSGDTDGAVPTQGTQAWIRDLNWTVSRAWEPYYVDGQVAGYVEEREEGKFIFATVHGAGHMAP